MSNDNVKSVESLITKAAESKDSGEAMRFSQAAQNAANALCALKTAATIKEKP